MSLRDLTNLKKTLKEFWESSSKREICRVDFLGKEVKLILVKRKKPKPYVINVSQNELFGLAYVPEVDEVVPGYPHLSNWRHDKVPRDALVEVKLNGTNIGLTVLENEEKLIRTRQSLFSPEFPVMLYSESFLKQLKGPEGKKIADKFRKLRSEVFSKYSDLYRVVGDYEYVYLKSEEALKLVLPESFWEKNRDILKKHIVFGELVGRINPIQVDENASIGIYSFDLDYYVFDILDKSTFTFLPRESKVELCNKLGLKVVKEYSISEPTLDSLRMLALQINEEGFVMKLGVSLNSRWKIKSEQVLEFARRGWAIQKGLILLEDLMNAINRGLEAVGREAHVDTLFEVVQEELKTDYPIEVVKRNYRRIRESCAIELAKIVALEEAERMVREGKSKSEIFRELNIVLPKKLPWLREWIDFKTEKALRKRGNKDKKRIEALKRRRKRIIQPVISYLLKKKIV